MWRSSLSLTDIPFDACLAEFHSLNDAVDMDIDRSILNAFEHFVALYSSVAYKVDVLLHWHSVYRIWECYDLPRFAILCRTNVIHWPQYSLYENNRLFDLEELPDVREAHSTDRLLLPGTIAIINIVSCRIAAELRKPSVNLVIVRSIVQSLLADLLRAGLFFTCVPFMLFLSLEQLELVEHSARHVFAFASNACADRWMARNAINIALGFIHGCKGSRGNATFVRTDDQLQAIAMNRGLEAYQGAIALPGYHQVLNFLKNAPEMEREESQSDDETEPRLPTDHIRLLAPYLLMVKDLYFTFVLPFVRTCNRL